MIEVKHQKKFTNEILEENQLVIIYKRKSGYSSLIIIDFCEGKELLEKLQERLLQPCDTNELKSS